MMAVTVKARASSAPGAKASFDAGTPQPLFETHLARASANNVLEYDVTADGKRFLLATSSVGPVSGLVLTVVSNWEAALKK
jgi:hypothetical protein